MTDPSVPQPKPGILSIAPYVGGKSSALGAKRVIKLSSNENPLGASPKAVQAYREQAEALHRYPDGNATLLREAIAQIHGLDPARVVCGSGSDELIGLLVHAYAGLGDEVLYSEHGFLMYKIYAQSNGATPVTAPEENLTGSVDALLARVSPRTKILFLANPNNPTGTYLLASEVKRLREALRPDIILALDAAYAEYAIASDYDDGASLVHQSGNTVMLRTFSKIYGLPALRLGWGYMPKNIADVLNRIRGPFNVSSPAIAAGIAAVQDQDWVKRARAHNTKALATLSTALQGFGLNVTPSQGNFVLVEFKSHGAHTAALANRHLLKEGIIVREVGNYGLPDHLRITVGTDEENALLVGALKLFFT